MASVGVFGQGELEMLNANQIYDDNGNPLGSATGTDVTVELLVGSSPSSLAPVPSSICYMNQGYFYGPGFGLVTISGARATSVVDYAVEVWSTAAGSYANAQKVSGSRWGESAVNIIELGSAGSPPFVGYLNFASFNANLTTPEPATIALGAFGAGALLLMPTRRRNGIRPCDRLRRRGLPTPAGREG